MPTPINNIARRTELARQLEASTQRIADYHHRLLDGTDRLKPIEYDRLLDDYHAELIRYDHLERKLNALEEPTKTVAAKERWYRVNKQQRTKIKY